MIQALDPVTNEVGSLVVPVEFHGQRMEMDIFMKARGSVSGTVYDAAGTPVAGAKLVLTTLNDNSWRYQTTDAEGHFAVSGLPVGPFSIKAVSVAANAQGSVMGLLPDDGGSTVQDVTIYRVADVQRGDINGTVQLSDGSPREGVVVMVAVFEGVVQKYSNWMRTGPDGGYAFAGVYAGNVTVDVRDDSSGEGARVAGLLAAGETRVFNVILKGTGSVTGTVQREDGLSPTPRSVSWWRVCRSARCRSQSLTPWTTIAS
jgi:hypothetical protein